MIASLVADKPSAHLKPPSHVLGVSTVATAQTRICRTPNRPSAQGAVQQRFSAFTAQRSRSRLGAHGAFGDKLDATTHVRINRQELEDAGARHQQSPAIQDLRVRSFEVVVQMALRVAENGADLKKL